MDREPDQNKFIADVMLGRLAKWLRIIGYDTLYFQHMEDNELIRRAVRDNRILLTRDTELHHRSGFRSLFIEKENLESQLVQVVKEIGLRPHITMGIRCPLCNEPLEDVNRNAVEGFVPSYVWTRHRDFSRCPRCGKIFWRGTHWEKIQKRLKEMGLTLFSDS